MNEPEDFSDDLFAQKVAGAAENVRRMRAYLLSRGVDATEFLEACDLVQAAAAGRPQAEGAVSRAVKTVTAFVARLNELPDFPPPWSEEERKAWELTSDLLTCDELLAKSAEVFQGTKSEEFALTAKALRAQFNELIREGKNPLEVMRDFQLMLSAESGEVMRRVKFRTAMLAIYWEQLPQEKWDEMSLEGKDQLLEILKQWREGEREKTMSSLPIADRRRLEAMEQWGPEDWGKSGPVEP
jgi:hypothetical protein